MTKEVSYYKFQEMRKFFTRYLPAIGLGELTDFYGDSSEFDVFYVRTAKNKKFELTISNFKYKKLYLWLSDTEFITFSFSKRIRPISHTIKEEESCKQKINLINGTIFLINFVEVISTDTSVIESIVKKQCDYLQIESKILSLPRLKIVSASQKY